MHGRPEGSGAMGGKIVYLQLHTTPVFRASILARPGLSLNMDRWIAASTCSTCEIASRSITDAFMGHSLIMLSREPWASTTIESRAGHRPGRCSDGPPAYPS